MSSRRKLERWPRFALEEVHRFGGILVGTFVVIHVVTIAIDSYLQFSLAAMLVPFAASYRPFWVALGIVAAELLAGTGDHEPLARPDAVRPLAQISLRELRGLDSRDGARARERD